MDEYAIFVLQISLGITYLFTSYKIVNDPKGWGEMLKPWVRSLLPVEVTPVMLSTAIFDGVLGVWLLSGLYLEVASILSILHIIQIFVATGISGPQYRDISVLGASIALLFLTW